MASNGAVALSLGLFALLVSGVWSCAVPYGGCRQEVCQSYSSVSLDTVYFNGSDYSLPETWLQGDLPKIGYVMGTYNKVVSPTGYDRHAATKGTPGLNLERFDLETNAVDPATNQPYPTPSTETDLTSCCIKCAQTDGCYLFQFFPADTPTSFNGGVQCYLLSGGTSTWDFPDHGTPFSGSAAKQAPDGARADVPLSFVGGRCNGTAGIIDDPHFVGAHGTRFDFNGQIGKSFCLTADEDVQVNAVLKGYKDSNAQGATSTGSDGKALRTWMRELAFLWKDSRTKAPHRLHLVARSGPQQERGVNGFLASASLDGKPLPLPLKVGSPFESGDLSLAFQGTVVKGRNKVQQDQFVVKIGEHLDVSLSMRVAHKKFQTPEEAQAHFNILVNHLRTTENVHGVLGQTYRNSAQQLAKAIKYSQISELLRAPIQADGESGNGFLEGEMSDYVTSTVTESDCRVSPF